MAQVLCWVASPSLLAMCHPQRVICSDSRPLRACLPMDKVGSTMIFTSQAFMRTQCEVASAAILISSVVLCLCGDEPDTEPAAPCVLDSG